MSYLGELRTNWRPLAAATAGLSAGMSLSAYTNAAMAPRFLEAFGWSSSDFALTGVIALLTFLFLPVYGRLTDLVGVRRVARIGEAVGSGRQFDGVDQGLNPGQGFGRRLGLGVTGPRRRHHSSILAVTAKLV